MKVSPTDIPNILHGYKIPKKLYKNLISQATWRHRSLSEELRVRWYATLDPVYNYPMLSERDKALRFKMIMPTDKKQICSFGFRTSSLDKEVLAEICNATGYKPNTNEFNRELVLRLQQTMDNTFYDDYIEREVRLDYVT